MGLLRPGDVLLAINDQSLEQATLRDGADLLQRAGDVVLLKVSKEGSAHLVGGSHPEPVVYSVELHRHGQSLGITLSGMYVIRTHFHTYLYTHTHMHTYIHTYIHTHTHTHIQVQCYSTYLYSYILTTWPC